MVMHSISRYVKLWRCVVAAGVCLLAGTAGCDIDTPNHSAESASFERVQAGRELIHTYGCGECHVIPGVEGARGKVGPPLTGFGKHSMIAGKLENTPANLAYWIQHPEEIQPNTPMPDLGVKDNDARDIAAYLSQLEHHPWSRWFE